MTYDSTVKGSGQRVIGRCTPHCSVSPRCCIDTSLCVESVALCSQFRASHPWTGSWFLVCGLESSGQRSNCDRESQKVGKAGRVLKTLDLSKPNPLTSLEMQADIKIIALQFVPAEIFTNCRQSDPALSFPEDMQPGDMHHPNNEVAR